MTDGHSGYSFSVTKNILVKLLNQIPLSPITDADFFLNGYDTVPQPVAGTYKGVNIYIIYNEQCEKYVWFFKGEYEMNVLRKVYTKDCIADELEDLFVKIDKYLEPKSNEKFKEYIYLDSSDQNTQDEPHQINLV